MTDPAKTPATSTALDRALRANAAFSGLSGLALLTAPAWIASWLGVSGAAGLLRALALGLVAFAVGLALLARSSRPRPLLVKLASTADFAWVAGSAGLLLGFPDLLTGAGEVVVGGVAVLVAGFGVAQVVGLRRRPGV